MVGNEVRHCTKLQVLKLILKVERYVKHYCRQKGDCTSWARRSTDGITQKVCTLESLMKGINKRCEHQALAAAGSFNT